MPMHDKLHVKATQRTVGTPLPEIEIALLDAVVMRRGDETRSALIRRVIRAEIEAALPGALDSAA